MFAIFEIQLKLVQSDLSWMSTIGEKTQTCKKNYTLFTANSCCVSEGFSVKKWGVSSQLTCTSILDCTLEEVRRYNADPRNVGTTQNISLVIDGRTLSMALSPDLQDRFIELVKNCRSVLCCRVTPLQKSGVVKTVREKLKVMTLAVGKHAAAHVACKVSKITHVFITICMLLFLIIKKQTIKKSL